MKRKIAMFASLICAQVCGALSLYMLLDEQYGTSLEFHLLGCVFAVLIARLTTSLRTPIAFEQVVSLFIPCIGGSVMALTIVLTLFDTSKNLTEDYIMYLDAAGRGDAERSYSGMGYRVPKPEEIEPLHGILFSHAPDDDKKNAVEALMRVGSPTAVGMLRKVLRKGDGKARVYAAGALSRIDEQYSQRLNAFQAEQSVVKDQDKGRLSVRIAELCLDYLDMSLCDRSQRATYIELGLQHADEALGLLKDSWPLFLQGRLLMADGRYDEAEGMLTLYLNQNTNYLDALTLRAECRYMLHDIEHLREDCRAIKLLDNVPEKTADIIKFWI